MLYHTETPITSIKAAETVPKKSQAILHILFLSPYEIIVHKNLKETTRI